MDINIIGNYTLIEKLGEGRYSVAFKAHKTDDENVLRTIKFLKIPIPRNDALIESLKLDVLSSIELYHKNIVKTYDLGFYKGTFYFVTQFVPSKTLHAYLNENKPLTTNQIASIAKNISSALSYSHELGLVHANISPKNIFFDENTNKTLLTDFHLQKIISNRFLAPHIEELDIPKPHEGEEALIPPEVLASQNKHTAKSDLYQLGIVLYKLFSGQYPKAIANKVQISSFRKDIPSPLNSLIMACIDEDPAKRPSSAKMLFEQLLRIYPSSIEKAAPLTFSVNKPKPPSIPPKPPKPSQPPIKPSEDEFKSLMDEQAPKPQEQLQKTESIETKPEKPSLQDDTKLGKETLNHLSTYPQEKGEQKPHKVPSATQIREKGRQIRETKKLSTSKNKPGLRTPILILFMLVVAIGSGYFLYIQKQKENLSGKTSPDLFKNPSESNAGTMPSQKQASLPAVNVSADMVLIGASSFVNSNNESVSLPDFFIDKSEVTVEKYMECVLAKKCKSPAEEALSADCNFKGRDSLDYPVNCITWQDANDYCAYAGKRLPTSDEWEKAAKGNEEIAYPWGNEDPTCEYGAIAKTPTGDCQLTHSVEVMTKPKDTSPYGVMDMAGNVREFVADSPANDYLKLLGSSVSQENLQKLKKLKTCKGGSWKDSYEEAKISNKKSVSETAIDGKIGFRCAVSAN
jgi:eukaryotic-like serine/threonine-protein kinase